MAVAELIGESPGIAAVREQVARLAGRGPDGGRLPPVLLLGETGTGKGLVARALHRASARRSAPFVDVNCAAIPDTLLEAELFGVERGAFTGADRTRPGLFQTAHRGTLFLDEIGLIPEALQSKLLKAVEERTVRRLGATRNEPVDVWVLAATSEDLDDAMGAGRFRRDLYHRLAVMTVRLPPLRERDADIPLLAEHFLAHACADYSLPSKSLAESARAALGAYAWPGNVRELANVMERAALLSEGNVVTATALGLPAGAPDEGRERPGSRAGRSIRAIVGAAERERLLEALEATGWNLSHAAARLHLPRNTLRYRMERHGLKPPPPSRRRSATVSPAAWGGDIAPGAPTPGDARERRLALLRVAAGPPPGADTESEARRAVEVVVEKVESFGGQVEELTATVVVAAFGLEPVEDAPRRAALAALAVQRAAERARRDDTGAWAARAGIHVQDCGLAGSGPALEIDAESRHATWPILEALVEAASPDAVLVSEAAATSLRRRFDLLAVAAGTGGSGPAYRLTGRERTGFGPGERITAFVGRREELALLRSRLASALGGRGQVVAIVGEAGIGKSRLLFEFRQGLAREAITCLEGRCLSYGGAIPYLPVLELLRQGWGLTEGDGVEGVADKLGRVLGKLAVSPDEASCLLQLLGVRAGAERLRDVNPELMKVRTFDALRHVALAASRCRPLVLAVEDLHWIDRTSDEVVAALVESLHGAPILLVVTYRPGYEPAWLARGHVTQVALPPLSSEDSVAVLRSALQTDQLAPTVTARLLMRAEGNPFFLEELAHALGDDAEGVAVPETVHGVLAARIDRLAAADRRLLQAAAVIGKDVPAAVLEAVAGEEPASVHARLRQLQMADFLWETRSAPELAYTFKHALTHEVAYAGLAPAPRRELHAKVARALIGASPQIAESRPEVVARHLTAADLPAEAIPYWREAGRSAIRRSANVEAVSHLRTAVALLARQPATPERDGQELELLLTLGPALVMTEGYGAAEVEALYRRAQALCEGLGETPSLFSALWGIALFHIVRGDLRSARAVGERLLSVAARSGSEDLQLEAHLALGAALFYHGRLRDARAHFETGLSLHDPERHAGHAFLYGQDPGVAGLGFLGHTLALQGHDAEAVAATEQALGMAEVVDHAFSRALALMNAAMVHDLRGDLRTMLSYAERVISLATEHRFPLLLGGATCLRARVLVAEGRHAEGFTLIMDGMGTWGATGAGLSVGYYLGLIADMHRAAGNVEAGLAMVAAGLAAAERCDERLAEPELYRLRGELLAADPATSAEAEESFRRAVAVAQSLGATVFACRAAASLATYLRARGRAAEAEQALAALETPLADDPAA